MKKSIYSKGSDLLRCWLTDKRHSRELTQRELAVLLDLHHSIVGKIETGERQVNVVELVQYCKVLNVDPVEVMQFLKLI